MADKKITQLTNITAANLVNADEFVVVDISADVTKSITLAELKVAVDSGLGFVRIIGDTMTGDLTVPNLVVSGTVDGVDIAARDAILTSTTTTANAALPKAGGTMTGDLTVPNVIVSGNVDGRDVSADGAKLDGIEASADVTDATNVAAAGAAMETGADFTGNVTFADGADISGTANLDIVDIDGAVNMATTALVTGVLTTTAAPVFNGGFTANDGSTITTADNTTQLELISTDTDATTGPVLSLYRNSASPDVNDDAGKLEFNAKNDADEKIVYADIFSELSDVSDGTEDGRLALRTKTAGSIRRRLQITETELVINEDSRDLDFRVESDADTHAFFVEGSTGNIGMSSSNPDSHTPQTHNPNKLSFVNYATGGTQFVAGRSDTTVTAGEYIGGYLFKTNDNSTNRFGGMIATADDTSGNGNLEFFPVMTTYDSTTTTEGSMQLDDSGDMYIRGGGIKVGRSHGSVYTSTEEAITIFHAGDGSNDTITQVVARDGTGSDQVFRHMRRNVVKSLIEENGDFQSATNSYGATSDGRLKENIAPASSQWNDIKALQFKNYSMIDAELDAPNMLGVIAQDLQAAGMNGLVKQNFKTNADDEPVLDADGNQEEYLSVKYSVLYMKAVKALQEAMAKIEVLETKVAALENA